MLSISQTLQVHASLAAEKVAALRTPGRFLVSGMLGGAYIGVGIVLMVSTAGPMAAAGDSMAKLVAGLVFGVALNLVMFAGADLATSAMMVLPQGLFMRSIRVGRASATVLFMFACNLLGALLFSALVALSGVLVSSPPAGTMLTDLLATRAAQTPIELFVRGLLCNALVCLAVWMGTRVKSEGARITLIFLAITAFVSSGFEHVVANMTIYGLGLALGDVNATWALFGGNLLWVGLGNLVGGGLVVGAGYWLIGGRPRFDAASESPVRTSTKLREVKDSGGRSLGINPVRTAARQEEDIRVDEALALIAVANERVDQIKFRFWFLHMIRHMRGFRAAPL